MMSVLSKIKRLLGFGNPYFLQDSFLEGNNKIGSRTSVVKSEIGRYSYMGADCLFYEIRIGRFCSIGNNVKVIAAQHPTQFASSHPFFYQPCFGAVDNQKYPDYKYIVDNQNIDIGGG